jgi:hypothetical protein
VLPLILACPINHPPKARQHWAKAQLLPPPFGDGHSKSRKHITHVQPNLRNLCDRATASRMGRDRGSSCGGNHRCGRARYSVIVIPYGHETHTRMNHGNRRGVSRTLVLWS